MPTTGFQYPTYSDWSAQWQDKFKGLGGLGQKALGNVDWLQNYYTNRNRAQLEYQANQPDAGNNPSINLPDPTQYFDPKMIQNLFNTGAGNLARAQGGGVSSAQRTAAALAGAGGSFNPAAFITQAGSQARQPYAQAFGQLEQGRASALTAQQQALLQALTQKGSLEEESRQFNVSDERSRQQLSQQYDMFLKQLQAQQQQTQAGALDWVSALAPLLAAPFTGGTSLLGYLFGAGKGMSGGGNSGGQSYNFPQKI